MVEKHPSKTGASHWGWWILFLISFYYIWRFPGIGVPSGKLTKNYGKSQFLMGKLTISMAMFNSYFDITIG